MKHSARILSLLLAAMLLLPACAQSDDQKDTERDQPDTSVESSTEEVVTADPNLRENVKDDLPDNLNYNDETIRIFYRPGVEKCDAVGTDNIGDYVTDGIWERNRTVEDRLGVTLDMVACETNALGDVRNIVKNMLLTGTADYDFFMVTGNSIIQAEVNAYLYDVTQMQYINLDQPWWWTSAMDELSIDGKIYNYLVGDLMLSCYNGMSAMYYNKFIYENAFGDPDELYTRVLDKTWTIDAFYELCEGVYTDVNGDGAKDDADIYGFQWGSTKQENDIHFLIGFDIPMYERTDSGTVTLNMNNERMQTALEKMTKLYQENTGVRAAAGNYAYCINQWAEGNTLFLAGRLGAATEASVREMEDSYGILPYPLLDEAQQEYLSLIHSSAGVTAVPRTLSSDRVDMVGAVIEAMAAETYRTVVTPYLESALKVKYSRDVQSGQVIDMIIDAAGKNFVFEYSPQTNNIILAPLNEIYGSTPFTSYYKKGATAAQSMLDKFVKSVQDAMLN